MTERPEVAYGRDAVAVAGTRRRRVLGRAVALAVALAASGPVSAVASETPSPPAEATTFATGVDTVEGTIVVRTEDATTTAERAAIATAVGGVAAERIAPDTFVVRLEEDDLAAEAAEVAAIDGVAAVQPELVYRAAAEPDDPCWRGSACTASDGTPATDGQAELRAIGAPAAWDVTSGSPDVVVAVLDTAIDTDPPHRDLEGKLLPGASFVRSRTCAGTRTARDHGTMAAGIIAARVGNGVDMAGLGWDTRVLPVEVLDDCGSGTTSAVAAGLRWAADNGADIVNLSLTGPARDPVVSAAVAHARSRGVLVVAAAGNEGSGSPAWPAADLGVVAVAATGSAAAGHEDRLAHYSNRGSWVDIAAPGTDVTGLRRAGGSTTPYDGTTRGSGTSFATPLVAAAAALVMASDPGLGAEGAAARLASAAREIPGTGELVSWGRLDVAAALVPPPVGYRLAAADGAVLGFGDAPLGPPRVPGRALAVGGAAHLSGRGYWLAGAEGGVTAFGAAGSLGSAPAQQAGRAVVGVAATTGGDGYWLATRDGRVLPFGAAPDLGSPGGTRLNEPVVGMAAARRGDGYWLVARDGGIFAFGSAPFRGSTGAIRLNQPIVGVAATPSGEGYWIVARDGGVFAFGDAAFHGSTGAVVLNQPIVGMVATPTGSGYWLAAADGGVFAFGDAPFLGSAGGGRLGRPVVAVLPR